MATVSKKPSNPSPKPRGQKKDGSDRGGEGPVFRAFNAVYRFLASLKLAIFSLSTLVIVLTIGMFYERSYGNAALQQYFYRTWWFGLLLAVLGINILCAATIRFPWKKRQTGFVVTHAGLIVLLIGSWFSFRTGDEGQVAMAEGDSSTSLVRVNDYTLRVQSIDEASQDRVQALLRDIFAEISRDHDHDAATDEAEDAAFHALQDQIARLARNPAPSPAGLRDLARMPAMPASYRSDLESLAERIEGNSYAFPFFPGPRPWQEGRSEVLTRPDDPFELTVTSFLPSAIGKRIAEPDSRGVPMIKVRMEMTPPNMLSPMDPLADQFVIDERRWISADDLFKRTVQPLPPAARLVFQHVKGGIEGREAANDFLEVPEDGTVESARLHYEDDSGRTRTAVFLPATETWLLPDETQAEGRTVTLPNSSLKVTYNLSGSLNDTSIFDRLRSARFDVRPRGEIDAPRRPITLGSFLLAIVENTKDDQMPLAEFAVSRGDGPEVIHWAVPIPHAALPPMAFEEAEEPNLYQPAEPLVRVGYYKPPQFDEGMQGLKGSIEVLGVGENRLYFRAINAEGIQNKGELKLGETADTFGGENRAMQATLAIDEFYPSARPRFTYVYRELPVQQAGQGVPAARVKVTHRGESEDRWVLLSTTPSLKPNPGAIETVSLDRATFNLSFDMDRGELPFTLKLVDFRRRFDPGTRQPSHYESDVLLYDEEQGIDGERVTISMNEPLSHRGYTFYQSSFNPPTNADGEFISIFQVRYDPTWQIIYFGCLMVVIGTFLQFYMRAGVFTDGGKRERERAIKRGKEPEPLEPVAASRDDIL